MDGNLKAGVSYEFKQTVSTDLIVPSLLKQSPEFQKMPKVLATGFMVGLIEWACIKAINPYLDWPNEQTVGIHVDLSHSAATPPGLEVTIMTKLIEVEGRRLLFEIEANDGVDTICRGTHERFVIYPENFNEKVEKKLKSKQL